MKSEVSSARSSLLAPLFCFALKEEARPFQKRIAVGPEVHVLITGIGRANAEQSIHSFLQVKQPTRVLTCGFAGALNPDLKIGEVLFATDNHALRTLLGKTEARPATFLCVDRIATTTGEKSALRAVSGADAVEMESDAIEAVCRGRGIPCATVRVISDTAHEDLPLDFNTLANPDKSLNYCKLALAIARAPAKIPALRQLQKNTSCAAERLAEALLQVLA